MLRRIGLALCLSASHGLRSLIAAEETAPTVERGIEEFNVACDVWDAQAFERTACLFEAAARLCPTSYPAVYWQGVAEFHAVLCYSGQSFSEATNRESLAIARATKALERAVSLDPAEGESHALLSTLRGIQIAGNPASAVWRGPGVLRHRRDALRNEPDNPRVHFLIGCAYYHAPAILGDKQQALVHFLKAETLFDREQATPAPPLRPRWGYSACLAFIGKLRQEAGDAAKAEAYFRKALKESPHNKLAEEGLASLSGKAPKPPLP